MYVIISFLAVVALIVIAYLGVAWAGLRYLFGVVIPYAAVAVFFIGLIRRVLDWASSPVPFRIPTTAGQQKSLEWIKYSKIENPSTTWGVVMRMFFEIVTFRSLFRNMALDYREEGPTLRYSSAKWLWLFAIVFHYSFLVVLLRHLRFFTEPIPQWVKGLEALDSFFEVGLPLLQISGVVLLGAVGLLFLRRIVIPQLRYISLPSDYFPLFLIMGIAATGILMRYFIRVDVVHIKELTMSLVTFHPSVPDGISPWFFVHLLLVCVLFAYFPFSKLTHMAGVFLSPTRNLANTNRMVRHPLPPGWKFPGKIDAYKVHTYEEYEEEFREEMKEAGIPVEKE